MTSKIPDTTAFEDVATLPLALSTAASALFLKRHLALDFEPRPPLDPNEPGVQYKVVIV